VFKTGFFFKPAIIFGSKESMEEYRTFEAGSYDTFDFGFRTWRPESFAKSLGA